MNQERLKEIEAKSLASGNHKKFEDGACVMEMVSYLANEPWSDHPKCACPILTEYAIRMNDRFNDEHRQLLKPFIPLLINTKATDEIQIARKRLIRWRNVTATYPMILELIKLPELAEKLRSFENTLESMAEAAKFLKKHKEEIYKNAYSDAYANAYSDADAYANAYSSSYAYSSSDAYANAYSDADAYANAYSYAYANSNAYSYAYANSDAYSLSSWRARIAAVALETLRLAIEIKS